jgi:anoctamin-10
VFVGDADRVVVLTFFFGGVADTVTNQAINAFTELGLPYLKQYYAQYKGEKRDKESGKKTGSELRSVGRESGPEEKRFLNKVEKELGLVEYSNFTGE